MPDWPAEILPEVQAVMQIFASLAVILLAIGAWWTLRLGRAGNQVQLELDLQVHDVGGPELVGELMVVLQNVGSAAQNVTNLFIEVRPSRHGQTGAGRLVPATNLISREDKALVLPQAVRHVVTWTFDIPRDERLIRVTAAISQGEFMDTGVVMSLNQKVFTQLGPSLRYLSRVFDVASAGFRRF